MPFHRFHDCRHVGAVERGDITGWIDRAEQRPPALIGKAVEALGGAVEQDVTRLGAVSIEIEPRRR
jgi:hypothetical protein